LFLTNFNILKIEQLIVQHLYNTKQVSIQGIGIFRMKSGVMLPDEGDKDFSMPADAFSFEYNLKTPEDEGLVDFIVKQTSKIKPLATSDLESYSILSKQFLNLGKPLVIEGVGTIQINQKGGYEFIPGQFVTPKIGDIPKQLREKRDESVSFESEAHSVNNNRKNLLIALSIAGVIMAGSALYYFLVLKNPSDTETAEQAVPVKDTPSTDTSTTIPLKIDSTLKNTVNLTDSLHKITTATPPPVQKESGSFNIILKDYNSKKAVQKAFDRLVNYGHDVAILTTDSVNYKLALTFNMPLADTVRVKDSIRRFFGGKPYVQF
jgi:hypothetical protein